MKTLVTEHWDRSRECFAEPQISNEEKCAIRSHIIHQNLIGNTQSEIRTIVVCLYSYMCLFFFLQQSSVAVIYSSVDNYWCHW